MDKTVNNIRPLLWRRFGTILVDPIGTVESAVQRPYLAGTLLRAAVLLVAFGAATLPRQLSVLHLALAPTGVSAVDAHYAAMQDGLTRMIVADRLVPSPTLLLAATFVVLLSEPMLALARDRRETLLTLALLGLAPLLVQQVGELVITYIANVGSDPAPGLAIELANRFETGLLLLWTSEAPAPAWIEILDARVNLVSLWCVALWALGLKVLDGERFQMWHLGMPVVSLAVGGIVTWILGPLVLSAVLGRP
ncbi:MAG: hypothetical protein AMS18_15260 [Gemmatimonas sp. SG8_17]|nr:MAG: hypothetical protein AMS18_15260 [Gemmatimonas sp. SG8_17]